MPVDVSSKHMLDRVNMKVAVGDQWANFLISNILYNRN